MNSILYSAYRKVKRDFAQLFLAQLFFFVSLIFVLNLVKDVLAGMIREVQAYAAVLSEMSIVLNDAADPAKIAEVSQALGVVESLTSNVLLFAYILVPCILFILWVVFQSFVWLRLKEKSLKQKWSYVVQMSAGTLVFFALVVTYVFRVFSSESFFEVSDQEILLFAGLLFVLLYFLTVFYSIIRSSVKETLRAFLKVSILRWYKILPVFILYFLVIMGSLMVFILTLTQFSLGDFTFFGVIPTMILLVCAVLLTLYCKSLVSTRVEGLLK